MIKYLNKNINIFKKKLAVLDRTKIFYDYATDLLFLLELGTDEERISWPRG